MTSDHRSRIRFRFRIKKKTDPKLVEKSKGVGTRESEVTSSKLFPGEIGVKISVDCCCIALVGYIHMGVS